MNVCSWVTFFWILSLCDFSTAWLYPCKKYGWGSFTIYKRCVLEDVVIKQETPLYRIFFPPVDLEIKSGFIASFNEDVAARLSNKTKSLTVVFCGIEDVFLKDTLESVDLRYNIISEVKFHSAKELKIWSLHLDYNHLRDASFVQDMESLVILSLKKNLISWVSWDTFKRLKKMISLNLAGNLIKSIDSEADFKSPVLENLVLAENQITHLDLSRLNFDKLAELNVSSNQLLSLNMFHFSRTFPKLKSADISNNPWNCGRKHRLEDRMILKGVKNEKSKFKHMETTCHENQLEAIALTTPEEVDEVTDNFKRVEFFHMDQQDRNEAKQRLAMAEERMSYLAYDLSAIDTAVQKLKSKVSHLFHVYNLRTTSRNFNTPN